MARETEARGAEEEHRGAEEEEEKAAAAAAESGGLDPPRDQTDTGEAEGTNDDADGDMADDGEVQANSDASTNAEVLADADVDANVDAGDGLPNEDGDGERESRGHERAETIDESAHGDDDRDNEDDEAKSQVEDEDEDEDEENDTYAGADETPAKPESTVPPQEQRSYGMGLWMKRTLSTAVKAQSQIGELLARPGRLYKEMSQESAELRRRAAELMDALAGNHIFLDGERTTGSVLALKDRVSGAAVGVQQDVKLLEVSWSRCIPSKEDDTDANAGDEAWETIADAPNIGYYRLTIDDADHLVRAEVRMTELFWRLVPGAEPATAESEPVAAATTAPSAASPSSVASKSAAASHPAASSPAAGSATTAPAAESAEKTMLPPSMSSVSLASMASFASMSSTTSQKDLVWHFTSGSQGAGQETSTNEDEASEPPVVQLSTAVSDLVKDLMKRSKVLQFDNFKNRADPANEAQLVVDAKAKDKLCVTVRRAQASKKGGATDTDDPDDAGAAPVTSRFPEDRLQVYAGSTHARAMHLVLGDQSIMLHARANAERDALIVLLRRRRDEVQAKPRGYDFEPLEQAVETRPESTSVSVSGTISLPGGNGAGLADDEGLEAADCVYSEVWKLLDYDDLAQTARKTQPLRSRAPSTSTTGATFSAFARRFSARSLPLQSFLGVGKSSSSAAAPAGASSSSVASSSPSGSAQGKQSQGEKAPPPVPPEEMPAEFDLYKVGGFGDRYDVELDMIDGEGLGVTLTLFDVVRRSSDENFPEKGATCVCISGFCPTVVAGEESPGQLEKSRIVRVGDALVAVNGIPIEPSPPVRKRKDLKTYERCTLRRVATLVEKERAAGREDVDVDRVPNPAARMTFTFAQSQTGVALKINSHLKIREELEEYKTKLYEANARASAVVTQCEQRLEKQGSRTRRLCDVVDEARAEAERAVTERTLVQEECNTLKAHLEEAAASAKSAEEKHEEQAGSLAAEITRLKQQKEEQTRRVKQLEASMEALANEGEAWVNTIGTKEDALRALEKELRAMQIKYENSQNLLDNAVEERERLRGDLAARQEEMKTLRAEVADAQASLEQAHDEADKLTARLRMEADEAQNEIQREKHGQAKLASELETVREQLAVSQSHARALKEANTSSEERAEEASAARQRAEMALNEQKDLLALAHKKIAHLEEQLSNERTVHERMRRDRTPRRASASSVTEDAAGASGGSGDGDEDAIRREEDLKRRNREVEAANELLRSQVKSLKSRVQGLSAEVTKVTQMDAVVAEKNELIVQVKLEEAKRLEAEDELTAYKGALLKYARQAQKDEKEGNGEPWTNRPKIFDHLYRTLLAEEDGSKTHSR